MKGDVLARVTMPIWQRVKIAAAEDRLTMRAIVEAALIKWLADREKAKS